VTISMRRGLAKRVLRSTQLSPTEFGSPAGSQGPGHLVPLRLLQRGLGDPPPSSVLGASLPQILSRLSTFPNSRLFTRPSGALEFPPFSLYPTAKSATAASRLDQRFTGVAARIAASAPVEGLRLSHRTIAVFRRPDDLAPVAMAIPQHAIWRATWHYPMHNDFVAL